MPHLHVFLIVAQGSLLGHCCTQVRQLIPAFLAPESFFHSNACCLYAQVAFRLLLFLYILMLHAWCFYVVPIPHLLVLPILEDNPDFLNWIKEETHPQESIG